MKTDSTVNFFFLKIIKIYYSFHAGKHKIWFACRLVVLVLVEAALCGALRSGIAQKFFNKPCHTFQTWSLIEAAVVRSAVETTLGWKMKKENFKNGDEWLMARLNWKFEQ